MVTKESNAEITRSNAITLAAAQESLGDKYVLCKDQFLDRDGEPRVYRIRALKDIPVFGVKAGDYGGWIEHPDNLSQKNTCWVKDLAIVCSGSTVSGFALVAGNALVKNSSTVSEHARVDGVAEVFDSHLKDRAGVHGNAVVGYSTLDGFASVDNNASVHNSKIGDGAKICDNAEVGDNSRISGTSTIMGDSRIRCSEISGDCYVNCSSVEFSSLKDDINLYMGSSVVASELNGSISLDDKSSVNSSMILGDNIIIAKHSRVADNDYLMFGPFPNVPYVIFYKSYSSGHSEIISSADNEVFTQAKDLIDYLERRVGHSRREIKKMTDAAIKYLS